MLRYAATVALVLLLATSHAYAQSRCIALRYKAAGKYASTLAKCWSVAARLGEPIEVGCYEQAALKFAVKWYRADAKGDCPPTDNSLSALILTADYIADLRPLLDPPSTTTTTSSTTSTTLGTCSFSGAVCASDADCGIPGVCWNGPVPPGGLPFVCHHKCETDADCPVAASCLLNGEIGLICSACGPDSTESCAAEAICQLNDCKQPDHPECTTPGLPCVITDPCLP